MFTKYILPAVAIAGALFAVIFVSSASKAVPTTQPVAQPAMAPFASYVAGAGIVEASTENIDLAPVVPGVVTKVYHGFGDRVKSGEPLFEVDNRDALADLKVNQAKLASAQANVVAQSEATADAENQWNQVKTLVDDHVMSREELTRRQHAAAAADAKLEQARADVESVKASIESNKIELDRRVTRAQVDGTVLQCKVHVGEYAPTGMRNPPLMKFGNVDVLNIRIDVDENDAWRIDPNKPGKAVAYVRGNRDLSTPLTFVKIEPYVTPKVSLTGDSAERVDTRVLQVLYSFDPKRLNVYAGQQMDVFIEAPPYGK